jgi:hypothetical protein
MPIGGDLGSNGGGGGSDPTFTTLAEGQLGKADATGKLVYSGITSDAGNVVTFDELAIMIENGSPETIATQNYANFESTLAKNDQTTGMVSGGLISIASATTLDITAGIGYFTDFTAPEDPQFNLVNFPETLGYTPANLATPGNYIITFDHNGVISEFDVNSFTTLDRQNYVGLGAYATNGTSIATIVAAPTNIGYNGQFTFKTFIREIIGPSNFAGNTIQQNGANLSLDNPGGTCFILGSNFHNDPRLPDELIIPAASPMFFGRVFRIAAGQDIIFDGPATNVINPALYDDGTGTLQPVTVNDFTVQIVYITPSKEYAVAYGQEIFNSLSAAVTAIQNGTLQFEETPSLSRFVRRAFIAVRNNATNLSDPTQAQIILDSRFRGGGAAVSGGIAGITSPGGSNTEIQFNDNGAFGAYTWLKVNNANQSIETTRINNAKIASDSTSFNSNLYLGTDPSPSITTSVNNIGAGYTALENLTTGSGNYAFGQGALQTIRTVNFNIAIGNLALNALENNGNNIAIGHQGQKNRVIGTNNISIGRDSQHDASVVPDADGNVTIGRNSAKRLTTGEYNVVMGHDAAAFISTGDFNTILGYNACGTGVLTGGANTVVGENAGLNLTSGGSNVFLGRFIGDAVTTGSDNVMIGRSITGTSGAEECVLIGKNISFSSVTTGYVNIANLIEGDITNAHVKIVNPANTDQGFLDGVGLQVQDGTFKLPEFVADPSGNDLHSGCMWFNITTGKFKGYDGTNVVEFQTINSP